MLEGLCGNKNVQKILIFLFVNGKCYGTQLQRLLGGSLTPLQKALIRLEKGGLITSYYEGKTRLYQFDPGYPLLAELEQLLKKAYTLLPTQKKKQYYTVQEMLTPSNNHQILLTFWEKLQAINQLIVHAKSKSKESWQRKGRGEVTVKKEGSHILIFEEKGTWQEDVAFSNAIRWTLDRSASVISLEHLRHGHSNPVQLFQLAISGPHALSSVNAHLYEGDTYFGHIRFDRQNIRLNWRVIGPNKNEEIDYYYS
jgi:hypothetical protein